MRKLPLALLAFIAANSELALADPPVADFNDPVLVKGIRLDLPCRIQQMRDGPFTSLDEMPEHAYTLTIPALLSAPVVSVVVPGPRKADAVRDTLKGPFSEACPASCLRKHVGAVLYLDRDAAKHVI